MFNVKKVKFDNANNSSIIANLKDKYYLDILYYGENKKSLWSYNLIDDRKEMEIDLSIDYEFICDEVSEKIYCYLIEDNLLTINEIKQGQLETILRKNMKYSITNAQVSVIENKFFIRVQYDDYEVVDYLEAYIFLKEYNTIVKIQDESVIKSIHMPKYIAKNDQVYLIIEESYVSEYEILEIRKSHLKEQLGINRILLYNLNELISQSKNELKITKKILIESKENETVSLLDIVNNEIFILYNNNNENYKLVKWNDIDKDVSFSVISRKIRYSINVSDLFFICNIDEEEMIIDKNMNVILKTEFNFDEYSIIGVFNERYVILDLTKYDKNDNQYKERVIYDSVQNKYEIYNCDFLIIGSKLV